MGGPAVVVLAAGASTRLGQPKQLLALDGESLVHRAARVAREVTDGPVVVVGGAQGARVLAEVADLDVEAVTCDAWERGPGASLKCGVAAVKDRECPALLVLACDQVAVEPEHLRALLDAGPFAAAEYGGTVGIPALVPRERFADLLALDDAQGAKPLLRASRASLRAVPMEAAALDIDTVSDWQNFLAGRR